MSSEVSSMIAMVIANPRDTVHRLVLADYLEEHGDPRGPLLRLVPNLLSTPRRKIIRPECRPTKHPKNSWMHFGMGMEIKIPQVLRPRYRSGTNQLGRKGLGRLFGIARLWDVVLQMHTVSINGDNIIARSWRSLFETMARLEMYACYLINARDRDDVGVRACWFNAFAQPTDFTIDRIRKGTWMDTHFFQDLYTKQMQIVSFLFARSGGSGRMVNIAQAAEGLEVKSAIFMDEARAEESHTWGMSGVGQSMKTALARSRTLDMLDAFNASEIPRQWVEANVASYREMYGAVNIQDGPGRTSVRRELFSLPRRNQHHGTETAIIE